MCNAAATDASIGVDDPAFLSRVVGCVLGCDQPVEDVQVVALMGAPLQDIRLALDLLDATGDIVLERREGGAWLAWIVG